MATRRRLLSASTMLIATLVVLLPVLAVLQYRWLGQVSDAERERLQAGWRSGAERIALEVDRELSRAFLHFQQHAPHGAVQLADTAYATRLADWQTASPYPRVLARAWVLRRGADGMDVGVAELTKGGTLVASTLPDLLRPWAQLIRDELGQPDDGSPAAGSRMPLVLDEIPALVVSLNEMTIREGAIEPPRFTGYTILQIDADYLARELLPALTRRHFGDGAEYQLALLNSSTGRVLYRSSEAVTAEGLRNPDASAPVMRVRFTEFGDLLHRVDTKPEEGGVPKPVRNFALSIVRREMATTDSGRRTAGERVVIRASDRPGHWQVVVKHRAGSLEAAVSSGRRRNLLASFGVLIVLGAAIGALAASTRRAQRLAQQQMEFVAGVSHELRTPLAVIRSAGENLADGVVDDPAQVRRYGTLVATEGRRLTELVEQVLEFAGGPGQRAKPQPVSVSDLVADVRRAWEPLARRDGFALTVAIDATLPYVLGDGPALQRAVGNLLGNAMKYSGDRREIELATCAGGGRASTVVISVADRGFGIPDQEREHVFEPFYRGRLAVDRQIHGSGLGLSLVKATMDAHGGHITISPRPGGGTTVCLVLPAHLEPAHAVTRSEATASNL